MGSSLSSFGKVPPRAGRTTLQEFGNGYEHVNHARIVARACFLAQAAVHRKRTLSGDLLRRVIAEQTKIIGGCSPYVG